MHDEEAGLVYNRARMRSPRLGRWMQREPLEYIDGMSLYQYVKSNPPYFGDPSGLQAVTRKGKGGGKGGGTGIPTDTFDAIISSTDPLTGNDVYEATQQISDGVVGWSHYDPEPMWYIQRGDSSESVGLEDRRKSGRLDRPCPEDGHGWEDAETTYTDVSDWQHFHTERTSAWWWNGGYPIIKYRYMKTAHKVTRFYQCLCESGMWQIKEDPNTKPVDWGRVVVGDKIVTWVYRVPNPGDDAQSDEPTP